MHLLYLESTEEARVYGLGSRISLHIWTSLKALRPTGPTALQYKRLTAIRANFHAVDPVMYNVWGLNN